MILTVVSMVFASLFFLGFVFCAICGYIELYASISRKSNDRKRKRLESKYLVEFEEWCKEHVNESEDEINE